MSASRVIDEGTRALQYSRLSARTAPPLTKARLHSVLVRDGVTCAPGSIREFAASPRNRMFTLRARGRRWIAKQGSTFPGGESWFFAGPGRALACVPKTLMVDDALDLVVMEELRASVTLRRFVEERTPSLRRLLEQLADALAALHDTPLQTTRRSPSPFPDLSPVDLRVLVELGGGARAVVTAVQRSKRLSDAMALHLRGTGTLGVVHGDLQFTNVLVQRGRVRLIDFECAGEGPVEGDLGAVVGSLMMAWCRNWSRSQRHAPRAAAQRTLDINTWRQLGRLFLDRYDTHRTSRRHPRRALVMQHGAAWMAGRTFVEASRRARSEPEHEFQLLLAEELARQRHHFLTSR